MVGDFPFMLSLVEAFLGFSAESISRSRDRSVTALIASMPFITARHRPLRRPSQPKQHWDFHQPERRLTTRRAADIAPIRKKRLFKFSIRRANVRVIRIGP